MTGTRERIIEAAATLLTAGGREAVSTRAVCTAAGVQAPAIYRLFGDKQGLLDAVASHGFEAYLRDKSSMAKTDDPVDDLRRGWDLHVGFGLENPAYYALIYGEPQPGAESPAARAAADILAGQVRRIAEAGRLRVSEERAAHLIHSAGAGITFELIGLPPERRDPELSRLARESIIAAVTTDAPAGADGVVGPVVALRAALPRLDALSAGEKALLREWLDRLSG
ncbi:TetR family transcriptional regulator [Actinoplanes sp. NBRC 14428]|uniref:TetR family transcriptional regulator n=1 Tax=Pseudosporangium ferrugineum TaxID=439699 RepID=A0A2T0RMG1_9ACTN|nr:TetR/AcrR family transcriptional regulator [Pseudosporangium ferrugineum]PRY22321.1 TetR family transcriptional regulator [Pseudosporangium ferrugineum]BCJ52528.1 TetR family transcriptional regulator [Actinoplanes sp. NBRC 14428]